MLLVVAMNTATTAAEVAQLLMSRSAVDGVIDGERRNVQARRLLVLGGLGVVSTVGKSMRAHWGHPVTQAPAGAPRAAYSTWWPRWSWPMWRTPPFRTSYRRR